MPLTEPYDPIELSAAQRAFPAGALDYMPEYEECKEAGQKQSWQLQLQRDWMFRGITDIQLIPLDKSWKQEDIDRAFDHLAAIQGSYAPKHEHKESAVAFLVERWFEHARWKAKSDDEWRGDWPSELDDVSAEDAERAREGADG